MSSTPKDFNKIRIAFMDGLKSPTIPPLAFKLGYLIAYQYANKETRVAYPAQTTLAADLGTSISTIKRLIDVLERHGLVVVPGDGRTKSSRYWIDPERVSPVTPFSDRKGVKKGCHPTTKKGFTGDTQTKEENQYTDRGATHPLSEGERALASLASDPPDLGGPADAAPKSVQASAPHPQDAASPTKDQLATGAEQAPPFTAVPVNDAFRELRAVWNRGHEADDTPRAIAITRAIWTTAVRSVAPEVILEAARHRVAAAEAGDGVRYLPQLAHWLAGKGWEKPPPTRIGRDRGRLSGRRDGPPRRRNAKPDFAEIGAKLAAEYEQFETTGAAS